VIGKGIDRLIPAYYDPPNQPEGSVPMRGDDPRHDEMFSYITPEARVRPDHPLRPIRRMTDAALTQLSPRFDRLYSTTGRPSIPPEKLLRALLLQLLYSIRSERLLMEELDYNILYRWFVGLSLDEAVWDATTFTKNRDRLLDGDIADAFFAEVLAAIKADGLLSDEHFTVDGTLLEAWASHKSFKPKGGAGRPPDDPKNPTVNFHGQTRSNDTHQSTTDPDARLYKKAVGREAKLGYLAHLLTENRHGLIVDTAVTAASGTAERDAAIAMLGELPLTTRRLTVAADKAYDVRAWVAAVRRMGITPHVAQNEFGYAGSALDDRTTRHLGYRLSHRKRKLIEQAFGWLKTVALFRKLRHRGGRLVDWLFSFGAAAYNLVRWRNLTAQRA
jgi:transposase